MEEFVGIDLGGTKTMVACFKDGKITRRVMEKTPINLNDGIEMLTRMVREVSSSPSAIGCACGGPLDYRSGVVSPLHMPQWRNVPLKEIIEKEFGCPFYVDVDTNAAAIGEYFFGGAHKYRNFIYITLSTGMGAGKLIDGKIYRGMGHPEMAHQSFSITLKKASKTFDTASHLCECGAKGCLESFISGNAIHAIYGRRAEDITDEETINEIATNFGEGLRNIIALHSPDGIFVGGGVAYGLGRKLLGPATDAAKRNLKIVPFPNIEIASLGYDSALMGAVALAIHGVD